ncbi:hypothetical protein NX059_002420 [Plenodomus lindquistii]|nr:hypothetical protein NX059_002420 [Plenodomus lindquistii]
MQAEHTLVAILQARSHQITIEHMSLGKINHDSTTSKSPAEHETKIVDYPELLTSRQKRYFDRLNYDLQPSSWIRASYSSNSEGDEVWHIETEPLEHSRLEEISTGNPERTTSDQIQTSNKLILILCEPSKSINTIPFSRDMFINILRILCVPQAYLQALFTGTPKFEYYESAYGATRISGLVLRTLMSRSEDWTLALSWVPGSRNLRGIIHGMQVDDGARLAAYLRDTKAIMAHPLNIPITLCEMLMESDSNGVKLQSSDLYRVKWRTNIDAYPNLPTSPEQDFAELTRNLNVIISRLAFHEMRVHANGVFVDEMRSQNERIFASPQFGGRPSDEDIKWSNEQGTMSQELLDRLSHLKTEQRALLLEITCNQKIAESQSSIVYNLVAQRDSKASLEMAKIQTQESYAMRTIAVMSIFFLPGTFVSSFLFMEMFNWQANKSASVVSPRLWIYWAVTLPLTFAVCSIWLFWLRAHQKSESQRTRHMTDIHAQSNLDILNKINGQSNQWYKVKWAKFWRDAEGTLADDPESMVTAITDTASSAIRNRAPTSKIQRARTMLQGPAR